MENPTFKLEGIIKTKEEMEDFEGPLTLILQLLSKNKIEIKDIKISLILNQYLKFLEEMSAMDLEIASEFVAMASHLVYIKTKTLLMDDNEISELEQLISSLEDLKRKDTYLQIKTVTDPLSEMFKRGGGIFPKPPEYFPVDHEYRYNHEKIDLADAILKIFSRGDNAGKPLNIKSLIFPQRIVYPVDDKAEEIIDRLQQFGIMRVRSLLVESRSRSELVATFIAILELCKVGSICLTGEEDDYTISYIHSYHSSISAEYEQGED